MCIVVDMFGKDGVADGQVMGLRDGELKPVRILTLICILRMKKKGANQGTIGFQSTSDGIYSSSAESFLYAR